MEQFKKWFIRGVFAVIALVVVGAVFGSWTTVPKGHVGVRNYWGNVSLTPMTPGGPYFKFPYVESIRNVLVAEQTKDHMIEDAASLDEQKLDWRVAVVSDLPSTQAALLERDHAQKDEVAWYESIVVPEIERCTKEVSKDYRYENAIERRDFVNTRLEALIQQRVPYFNVKKVIIRDISQSPEVKAEIEKKIAAEQRMLTAEFDTSATITRALGESEAIRLKAQALQKNQGAVLLDAIQKWNGVAPTTLVIGSLPQGEGDSTGTVAASTPPIILNPKL